MGKQTNLIPGEEERKDLNGKLFELKGDFERALEVVDVNATFLKSYAKTQLDIFKRCEDLETTEDYTNLADRHAEELRRMLTKAVEAIASLKRTQERLKKLAEKLEPL